MADFSTLTTTSAYASLLTQIGGRDTDLAMGLDPAYATPTNVPTNGYRINSVAGKFQRYNGTTWIDAFTNMVLPASTIGGLLTGSAGIISNGTLAAGTYSGNFSGVTGAARDILIAQQAGYSTGLTVKFDGTKMVYAFADAGATTAFAGAGTFGTSLSVGTTLGVTGAVTFATDLTVPNGGTGLSSLTVNNLVVGNGVSPPTFIAPGAANNVLKSNGTVWTSAPTAQIAFAKLTASGNFTTPANVNTSTVFELTLVGGGAGGGGSLVNGGVAGGGGAGGAATFYISGLSPSTAYAVLIGAAGAAGTTSGTSGGVGGTSQITIGATVYSCTGGAAGVGTTTTSAANRNSPQGTVSASIFGLQNDIIYQTDSSPAITISGSYTGSNGAGLPYGTAGSGGYSGTGGGAAGVGFGVGGGGGVASTAAGGDGAPGLFTAKWVA
jgi:hypothetical protein